MRPQQQILLLTGASAVAAVAEPEAAPAVAVAVREFLAEHPAPAGALDKRQTLEDCAEAAESLMPAFEAIPQPDPSLVRFIASQTHFITATDPCVIPAATGSLTAEYSSWASELVDWQSEHSPAFEALLSACTGVPEISSALDELPFDAASICEEPVWETAAPAEATASDDDDEIESTTVIEQGESTTPEPTAADMSSVSSIASSVVSSVESVASDVVSSASESSASPSSTGEADSDSDSDSDESNSDDSEEDTEEAGAARPAGVLGAAVALAGFTVATFFL